MEIITLERGEAPPLDADCVRIFTTPAGTFELIGSALCDGDSISFVPEEPFASHAAACDEGVAWADAQAVKTLYVATDPAPTEADKPL